MDALLIAADTALRTLFAPARATRATPQAEPDSDANALRVELSESEKQHAAGLMRVNHVGEICAQALYTSQALVTQNAALRQHFRHAASEEEDHLAWTAERLQELGSRTSLLNPLWYAGAFAIGCVAGKIGGDQVSLGFVVETENQVEAHLQSHLENHLQALPEHDVRSRAIVQKMQEDEAAHAAEALDAGAVALPYGVQKLMRAAAKVMTTVAYKI